MSKIATVCQAKCGVYNVLAMLDDQGAIVTAIWVAFDGTLVEKARFPDIKLHPEWGRLRLA